MRISPQKTSKIGFTLIEMMVVVAIIALVAVAAIPNVNSYFKVSLNTASRELASVVHETFNSAAVTGRVHRIVYNLDAQEYWVEVGPENVLLDTAESREKDADNKKFGGISASREEPEEAVEGEAPPATTVPQFQQDETITRNRVSLPRGVRFENIITEQEEEPLVAGMAYTHFFPHGASEQTIIHLADADDHKSSLVIQSLLGRTEVVDRYMERKDAFQ